MNLPKLLGTITLILVLLGLAVFAVYINYDNLLGAFGSGPPYYKCTTNMDKWQNPIPYLLALNVVVVVLLIMGAKWIFRFYRNQK